VSLKMELERVILPQFYCIIRKKIRRGTTLSFNSRSFPAMYALGLQQLQQHSPPWRYIYRNDTAHRNDSPLNRADILTVKSHNPDRMKTTSPRSSGGGRGASSRPGCMAATIGPPLSFAEGGFNGIHFFTANCEISHYMWFPFAIWTSFFSFFFSIQVIR